MLLILKNNNVINVIEGKGDEASCFLLGLILILFVQDLKS